jgi:hypothetical protein
VKKFLVFFCICTGAITAFAQEANANRYRPEVLFKFASGIDTEEPKETLLDFVVGEQFWTVIEVKIKTNIFTSFVGSMGKNPLNRINVTVTIPNTEIIEYWDLIEGAAQQTPFDDPINGVKVFEFYAFASADPSIFGIKFRCKALVAGQTTINVKFGSQVNSIHDRQRTIMYIGGK